MKKFFILIAILTVLSNLSFAQSTINLGINGVLAIPTGEISENYKTGFGAGVLILIPTSNPTISVTLGAAYESYPGKTVTETSSGPGWYEKTTTEYAATSLISIFIGPKIGQKKGPYFLPAISVNLNEGEIRFGLDIGGGFLIPMGAGKTKFNLGAKYSLINLIGKEENEKSAGGFRIFAGLVF